MAITISNSGLTLSAHPGDGVVLLGFSLEPAFLKTVILAGKGGSVYRKLIVQQLLQLRVSGKGGAKKI